MQRPPDNHSGLTEAVSRPMVVVLRFVFFLLIFYLLLSIAAGLLMPGQEVGRYALVTEIGQNCEDLQERLQPFNVNGVDYRVIPAEMAEVEVELQGGALCWLEISGVPESGVGAAAAPLYDAAMNKTTGPLSMERAYQPRFGQVETIAIWLLSFLLAAIVLAFRLRKQRQEAGSDT